MSASAMQGGHNKEKCVSLCLPALNVQVKLYTMHRYIKLFKQLYSMQLRVSSIGILVCETF